MTMPGDLLSGSLIEVARDLREKRVTARELTEAAIARHERFGERLHAYSLWAPEQARAVAAAADAAFSAGMTVGPLQGLPVSGPQPTTARVRRPSRSAACFPAGSAAPRSAAATPRRAYGIPHGCGRVRPDPCTPRCGRTC